MGARWVSLNWVGLLQRQQGSQSLPCLKQVGWETKLGREGERAGARGGTGAWACSLQVRSEEAGQQGAA